MFQPRRREISSASETSNLVDRFREMGIPILPGMGHAELSWHEKKQRGFAKGSMAFQDTSKAKRGAKATARHLIEGGSDGPLMQVQGMHKHISARTLNKPPTPVPSKPMGACPSRPRNYQTKASEEPASQQQQRRPYQPTRPSSAMLPSRKHDAEEIEGGYTWESPSPNQAGP
ncbi:unnamed protein product, partial [Chrysoparadoxa australica]